jgi:hypothetical protein
MYPTTIATIADDNPRSMDGFFRAVSDATTQLNMNYLDAAERLLPYFRNKRASSYQSNLPSVGTYLPSVSNVRYVPSVKLPSISNIRYTDNYSLSPRSSSGSYSPRSSSGLNLPQIKLPSSSCNSRNSFVGTDTYSLPPMNRSSGMSLPPMNRSSGMSLPPMNRSSGMSLPPMNSSSGMSLPPMNRSSGMSLPPVNRSSGMSLPPMNRSSGMSLPPMNRSSGMSLPPMNRSSGINLPGMSSKLPTLGGHELPLVGY